MKDSIANKVYRRTPTSVLVTVFLCLALLIVGSGLLFYSHLRTQVRKSASDELEAITNWKLREIQTWRVERLRDAKQLTASPYNSARMAEFLLHGGSASSGEDLHRYLIGVQEASLYSEITMVDTLGVVRLATGAHRAMTADEQVDYAREMRIKVAHITDIHMAPDSNGLQLDIYAPIWYRALGQADSQMIGLLVLHTDPEVFLYPLLATWPTPVRSGESELVRREGDDVVYLSRLKHAGYQPLGFRLPIAGHEKRAGVQAVTGTTGLVQTKDYRGVDVEAVLRPIPDSPWFLIVKMDQSEILAPLRIEVAMVFGVAACLILFVGAVILFWWNRIESRFFRRAYAHEKERAAMLERERAEDERQVAMGRMAARIAHEINNPLTGIKNSFTLVKRAVPTDHRYYEYVNLIERELSRIARIVRQMFELYRQERRIPHDASPADIISDVGLLLEGNARSRGVTLDLDVGGVAKTVKLDEDSLRQVLFCIIQNAIEASPSGSHVQVAGSLYGSHLAVTVTDHGSGIPESLRSKIFEPFFSTKEGLTSGGLGLGLSVTRGLLENLGGIITFDNLPEGGTAFKIIFPVRVLTEEIVHV